MMPPPTPPTIASDAAPTISKRFRTASSVPVMPPTSTAPRSMRGGTVTAAAIRPECSPLARRRGSGSICAPAMDQLRARLDGLMKRAKAPGLQYVVVHADRIVFAHDGGLADVARSTTMTGATTMMAYSMSKTITAAAVLQLVDQGQVSLDDPIEKFHETPYDSG